MLGTGTYGLVQLAVHKKSKHVCAIKSVSKVKAIEGHQVPHILAERNILMAIESPFIVNLRGAMQDDEMVYFVLDFVQGGELFTLLQVRAHRSDDRANPPPTAFRRPARFDAAIIVPTTSPPPAATRPVALRHVPAHASCPRRRTSSSPSRRRGSTRQRWWRP